MSTAIMTTADAAAFARECEECAECRTDSINICNSGVCDWFYREVWLRRTHAARVEAGTHKA